MSFFFFYLLGRFKKNNFEHEINLGHLVLMYVAPSGKHLPPYLLNKLLLEHYLLCHTFPFSPRLSPLLPLQKFVSLWLNGL